MKCILQKKGSQASLKQSLADILFYYTFIALLPEIHPGPLARCGRQPFQIRFRTHLFRSVHGCLHQLYLMILSFSFLFPAENVSGTSCSSIQAFLFYSYLTYCTTEDTQLLSALLLLQLNKPRQPLRQHHFDDAQSGPGIRFGCVLLLAASVLDPQVFIENPPGACFFLCFSL